MTFPPDYRQLLTLALPVGDRWPDWRTGDAAQLRERLAWPVDARTDRWKALESTGKHKDGPAGTV